jgi:signal transduction histidine kinase
VVVSDTRLVRAVAGISMTVQRKLLFAFAVVVVLLVTVGALGLSVMSESNHRDAAFEQLPERLAVYQQLYFDSYLLGTETQSRNSAVEVLDLNENGQVISLAEFDGAIEATLELMSPLTDVSQLRFVPPANETQVLRSIHADYVKVSGQLSGLRFSDEYGDYKLSDVEFGEVDTLNQDASVLEGDVGTASLSLAKQDQDAYLGSQHLFIGVAAASAILAAILAFVLSRALVGPIRKMDTQLAAIASGDFSSHVNVPNRDELGALAANLNRMNDELGRLYQEVEAASKHKSEFLANMSHELRTPLNAVIGFSDVLRDQMFGELNEKQIEYVNDIHTSGRHLLTLVNDILDLSKIEAGRMELQLGSVNLPEVLQNAIALMRERATRQGIGLGLDVGSGIGVIEADERLLKQLLFNLLANALNFTDRGGHVDVVARDQTDEVVISVRDDGVGIAPADQARIFEEFEQARKSSVQEGTGLGLALSRRFVAMHGGHLGVQSTPGKGSTFTFTLPKAGAPLAAVASDAAVYTDATAAPITPGAPS